MKGFLFAGIAAMATVAGSVASHATTMDVSFSEAGADLTLTIESDANTGPLGTSPNTFDPVGAFIIDKVTGTFSDALLHIKDAKVAGLEKLNVVSPEPGNLLAPARFSLLKVAHGVSEGGVISPGLHYDNLFYPDGSPQTASDYSYHGGLLDIYGLAFTLEGGLAVNVWSNGDFGGGPVYSAAVTNRIDVLPVPLPAAAPLFGVALTLTAAVGYGKVRKDSLTS